MKKGTKRVTKSEYLAAFKKHWKACNLTEFDEDNYYADTCAAIESEDTKALQDLMNDSNSDLYERTVCVEFSNGKLFIHVGYAGD